MPFIETKTNVKMSDAQEKQLKEGLGQAISLLPGKSENWLMLAFEDDTHMYFREDDSKPVAFVDVKIFGQADRGAYSAMTAELSRLYKDVLGVESDHMYIRYLGSSDWGWNGGNF